MQTIAQGGFTEEQVLAALRGIYGTRQLEFRYELLDENNSLINELTNVLNGSVDYEGLADVKRTAKFTIRDEANSNIDYLRHRIKPWVRLYIPDLPTPGALQPSESYDAAVDRVRFPLARWRFNEITGSTLSDEIGSADLLAGDLAVINQQPLVADAGRGVRLAMSEPGAWEDIQELLWSEADDFTWEELVAASDEAGGLIGPDAATVLNAQSALSFAGWIKTDSVGTATDLLTTTVSGVWAEQLENTWSDLVGDWSEFSGTGSAGITISFTEDRTFLVTLFINDDTVQVESPANMYTTDRIFLAFSWTSGAELTLYINGERVNAAPSPNVVGVTGGMGDLLIGGNFNGVIDDFLFAGSVISPTILWDIYVNGAAIGPAAPPGNRYVEWPQGVFLMSSPQREIDEAGVVTRQIDAYDQSVVLQSQLVGENYYVGAGESYTNAIIELLENTPGIPSYSVEPNTATLPALRVWEAGTSHLEIINDLCSSLNYEAIFFDESGTAVIRSYIPPQDRTSSYTYDASSVSVLVPGASQSLDLYEQANQWVLVVSEPDRPLLKSVYTNDDPASQTSTANRGRIITDYRSDVDAFDQTALDAKAEQLAQEASQVYEQVEFETAIMPIHGHRDIVRLSYPGLVTEADYSETKWSYDLETGATMRHSARRVIILNGTFS